jgi:2-polyprenyl-3-methyl-5-hydroxy-6-metoxy-1,4-benzoquinol methylase
VAQEWKVDRYAEHAPFVPLLGQSVLGLLNPQRGERILDVGSGDGALSAKIREAGATVVGVDGCGIWWRPRSSVALTRGLPMSLT